MDEFGERCCWEPTCHSVSIAYWKLALRYKSRSLGHNRKGMIRAVILDRILFVLWFHNRPCLYAPRDETDAQTPMDMARGFFTNKPYFCLAAQLPHARGSAPLGRAPLQLNRALPRGALSPNGGRLSDGGQRRVQLGLIDR